MADHAQSRLNLPLTDDPQPTEVETYRFDHQPIKGYPELRWHGKRPFTSTHYYPAQLKERHSPAVNGWRNTIYWGDNLQVMSHLLKDYRGRIQLVYIDPPFDSKAEYKKQIWLKGSDAASDHSAFEEAQYIDIWTNDEYLQFMYERLVLIRELMSTRASIYLQCDSGRVHLLRCILDELFGHHNFQNDIIWKRTGSHNSALKYGPIHDTLLFYSKTDQFIWNPQHTAYDDAYLRRFSYEDADGRKFQPISLIAAGTRSGSTGQPWRGIDVSSMGNHWRHTVDNLNALDRDGRIYWPPNKGFPRLKFYLDEAKGSPIQDLWLDIPAINSQAKERVGYPTQKPETLVERIVKASSNPGDIVFDCFMGSGTTQAVAMKLGRRFIGADINLGAVQITTKRLIQVAADLKQEKGQAQLAFSEDGDEGQPTTFYPGFEVYNVNHYDIFRNPVEARDLLLDALEVHKLPSGHIFDGEKDGRMIKIMPVNRIATREDLNPLITNFDYKAFERRRADHPTQPVEKLTLVCMGHEPDLAAQLKAAAAPYDLDVQVVDILRDRADIQFKRDSEARITTTAGFLTVEAFYPMNLLSKLSLQKEYVEDWRELVESIMIDWNYDGAVLEPAVVDIPAKNELVSGRYPIPADAGTIRIKITDLLSESLEQEIPYA